MGLPAGALTTQGNQMTVTIKLELKPATFDYKTVRQEWKDAGGHEVESFYDFFKRKYGA